MAAKIAESRILFPKKTTGRPREKVFLAELQTARTGFPSIIDGVYTADGSASLRSIFGEQTFAFPKPPTLIQALIEQATNFDSIIMDSFAGSGTTGHAVLAQNKADGGNRRFICIEMDESICRDVTAHRIRKAIEGYGENPRERERDAKAVPGLGGGFRFCKLGHPLFDEHGNIAEAVSFADLARHVFFTETGVPLPKQPRKDCPLLGAHENKAVYLLFNGVLGDKRPQGGNVLTHRVLEALPPPPDGAGLRVIYAEASRIGGERLKMMGIEFRQLPYEIKVD